MVTFLLYTDPVVSQRIDTVELLGPICAASLTTIISSLPSRLLGRQTKKHLVYDDKDVPALQTAYLFCFISSACTHVAVFLAPILRGKWRLGMSSGFGPLTKTCPVLSEMSILLLALILASWCLYSVHELWRMGFILTKHACVAAVFVAISMICFGPSATYAATWYWREGIISCILI